MHCTIFSSNSSFFHKLKFQGFNFQIGLFTFCLIAVVLFRKYFRNHATTLWRKIILNLQWSMIFLLIINIFENVT